MTRTIKLNTIKNNKLTIISTIRLICPCETSSSVFKTTWPTLHSSPVLPSRRYMVSGWPAVVPSIIFPCYGTCKSLNTKKDVLLVGFWAVHDLWLCAMLLHISCSIIPLLKQSSNSFTFVRRGSLLSQLDGQLLWQGDLMPYRSPNWRYQLVE